MTKLSAVDSAAVQLKENEANSPGWLRSRSQCSRECILSLRDCIRKVEGEKKIFLGSTFFIRSVFALYGFTLRFSAPTLNPDLVCSIS